MAEKRNKRFCPWCGERVRHSASRCPYCKSVILTWRLVFTYILVAVLGVAAIFLVLDYLNVEFFK